MSASGALFDLLKLQDVSKNVISLFPAAKVYEYVVEWAKEYDKELYDLFIADPEFATGILNIDREGKKPRKDLATWSDVRSYVEYFFDKLYTPSYELPENITPAMAAEVLEYYLKEYNHADNKDEWFARVKACCEPLGYTPNVKEYKKAPEAFKGHVGDVSTIIRLAVTSRRNTPDLYAIMQLLGEYKVRARMTDALNHYKA